MMGKSNFKVSKENRNQLIKQARIFRQNPTKAEALLWEEPRNRKLGGFKFKRQRVFGPFILDFYCPKLKLVVEIDGGIHRQQQEYDSHRTDLLESYGLTVIRFSNREVIDNLVNVLRDLLKICVEKSRDINILSTG